MREIVLLDSVHEKVRDSDDYYSLFIRHGYDIGGSRYDLVFHAQKADSPYDYVRLAGSGLFVRERVGIIPVLVASEEVTKDDSRAARYLHDVAGYLYDFTHRFLNRWALRDRHTRVLKTAEGETEVKGTFLDFYGLDDIGVGKALTPLDSYLYTSDARLRDNTDDITDYLNLERLREEVDKIYNIDSS